MSKNYFGVLDSRNTKYQGLIKDDSFGGIGILVDKLFTTIVSNWKGHSLNGPSLIIFANLQILMGQLQDNKPKGIICFQANEKEKLIINFDRKINKKKENILTIVVLTLNQSITHLQKKVDTQQYQFVQTHYYKKQQDQLKILTNIFQSPIIKENIDLRLFIQKNFIEPYQYFELSGKNQLLFGFKNSNSLGFKFQNNSPTSIGNFNKFPRNLIFGRKIYYNFILPNKTKIQEGNFQGSNKTFTFLRQKGAPIQCQKCNQEYFKRSTTFRNQFSKLQHVDKLFTDLKNIQKNAKDQISKKVGQALLQNNYGSLHQNKQQLLVKQYTLSEVKQEIYRAAARKQGTFRTMNYSPLRSSINKHVQSEFIQPTTHSRNSYLGENRKTNQFRLNSMRSDQNERKIIQNEITLSELNRTTIFEHYNKPDLIKDVNQIINAQKQYEKALLKQLIRQEQYSQEILQSQRQKFFKRSPNSNQIIGQDKYRRYERQISHFMSDSPQRKRKSKSLKKTYNYADSQRQRQKQRQRNVSPFRLRAQTNLERPFNEEIQNKQNELFMKRNNTSSSPINPFEQPFSHENTSKHDHLAKYKERKRQNKLESEGNHQNRYHYLSQIQEDQENYSNEKLKSENTPIRQLKLFGVENYNNRSSSVFNQDKSNYNIQSYRDKSSNKQIRHSPSRRQTLRQNVGQLQQQTNRLNDKQLDKQMKYGQKNFNYRKTFQMPSRKRISQNQNQYLERDRSPKKAKRTYHYVD